MPCRMGDNFFHGGGGNVIYDTDQLGALQSAVMPLLNTE